MNIIFSPSKEMNFERENISFQTEPLYEKKANKIIEKLKSFDIETLGKLSKTKDKKLSELSEHLDKFSSSKKLPALLAYNGVAFRQLDRDNFLKDDWNFIREHVRILSALYGINRGTDLIKFHRLDMTMKVFNENFYKFWFAESNNSSLLPKSKKILNLASKEFSKLLDKKGYDILTVEFLEDKNGTYKSISTNSKKARGNMLNFIIKNKINNIENLKKFNENGYYYSNKKSSQNYFVFLKD